MPKFEFAFAWIWRGTLVAVDVEGNIYQCRKNYLNIWEWCCVQRNIELKENGQ